ncbi:MULTISPECIES: DUF3943 domain-containing protein [Sphingobacterium]|uniref:DUF3943 domain-containing protein n=1 Tax=Sphingobacterium litopenaei TaxID=2763500 RepID=A0ABR7YC53_9SPHI|nr:MULTISPECIES: DUF3943 domain-containing protein [Sphingobacterium]MBD1428888.1 DUF3943 domain-containing protein [Sphingobacterium litopenaei]NGM72803.1 DUF3943 domain-containing protein [Sphingobacterium sp. SGL-16]
MLKYIQLLILVLLLPSLLKANESLVLESDSILFSVDSTQRFPRNFWKPINIIGQDSVERELIPTRKKHFWRAGTEWFLAQAFPATFNRFITVDPYSFITFKNFIDHQKFSAWDWDDNQFTTNQFDHPYHGQLYFNSFRSNGYNFYESSIATLAGSYIWETAGETQHPSINDLVNTTFGGIILGEMTHRVSRNILARSKNGQNMIGNEIVALLVNPVNSLNRLLDGKWGKKIDDYYAVDSSHISAEFDMGLRRFDAKEGDFLQKGKNSIYTRLRFHYSNGDHNYKRPFDEFHVNFELANGDSTTIQSVNVHALLSGAKFFKSKKGEHFGTLNAHYDFYNNDAFFYGAQSLVYNWNSEFRYKKENRLNLSIGAGAVVLAAVPDPYLLYGASRNYNYGSGASYRFRGALSLLNRLMVTADYNGGYFHTISGTKSYYILHTATLEGSLRLFKRFSLNVASGYFGLQGHFRDQQYPDFQREFPFGRISVGYNIQF